MLEDHSDGHQTMMRSKSPLKREPVMPEIHCAVPDQRRLLAASPYFHSLDAREIEDVQRRFTQRHYAEGSTIHLMGAPAKLLSIVAVGTVRLVRSTLDGKDVVLGLLGPGDHFGSLAELGDASYRETAIAHTECCILSTTSGDFSRMLETYPGVALDSLHMVADRLRTAHGTIEQLSAYPVEQRIASTLLHLADRIGVQQETTILIDVPLSRQDLADMTGTTVETASRVMSDFKRAGLIESGRRWTVILDEDGLRDRADY